jgi:hypothetical protein
LKIGALVLNARLADLSSAIAIVVGLTIIYFGP